MDFRLGWAIPKSHGVQVARQEHLGFLGCRVFRERVFVGPSFPHDAFKVFLRHAKTECPSGAHEFCQAVLTEERKLNEAQPGAPTDAR